MSGFIQDLLQGGAQTDTHYWASVLLAYAMVWVALMILARTAQDWSTACPVPKGSR